MTIKGYIYIYFLKDITLARTNNGRGGNNKFWQAEKQVNEWY